MKDQEKFVVDKAAIKRGEAIDKLFRMPEWEAVAFIFEELSKKWKSATFRYDATMSLEKLALERVQYVSMLAGLEAFFRQLNMDLDEFVASQHKDDPEEEEQAIPQETKKPFKTINPYREKE